MLPTAFHWSLSPSALVRGIQVWRHGFAGAGMTAWGGGPPFPWGEDIPYGRAVRFSWRHRTTRFGQGTAQWLNPARGENPLGGAGRSGGEYGIRFAKALGCGTAFEVVEFCHPSSVPLTFHLTFQPVAASNATSGGDACLSREGERIMGDGNGKEILRHKSQVTSHKSQVTSHKSQVTSLTPACGNRG